MRVENDILIPEMERLLRDGHEVRFTPAGQSMRPFIEGDRDSVILAPLRRKPRRGDVVLARAETLCGKATYVLHRILHIEEETLVLQGDGNLSGEERCKVADVIGIVVRVESPSGRRKWLPRGILWQMLMPVRHWLLKIYRHTTLKWHYTQ